jgi:hypothetical protein
MQKVEANVTSGSLVAAIGGRSVEIHNSTISISGRFGLHATRLEVNNLELTCAVQAASCIQTKELLLGGSFFNGSTNTTTFVSPANLSSSKQSRGHELYGEYVGASARDGFGNISLIHFATFPPCGANCSFLIQNNDLRIEIPRKPGINGMIRSLPVGGYRLTVGAVRYCPRGNDNWKITEGATFISNWHECANRQSEKWQIIGIAIGIGAAVVIAAIVVVIVILRKRAAKKVLDRCREFVVDTGPSHVERQSGTVTMTPLLKD